MRILTDLDLKPRVRYRLIADIFTVWKLSLHELHVFLDKINELDDNI